MSVTISDDVLRSARKSESELRQELAEFEADLQTLRELGRL